MIRTVLGFDEAVWQAVEDHNGSLTIGYKNDDSIHLVGDNKRSPYCCKYDNSNSSIICTAMKCSKLIEKTFIQGTQSQNVVSTRPSSDAKRSEVFDKKLPQIL